MPPRPQPWTFDADGGFNLDRINAHIAAWAAHLGLSGWQIRFSIEPTDENCRGNVEIDVIHRYAAVRLDSNIPASQVDRCLVHELLHVLAGDTEDTFDRALGEHGEAAAALLRGDWTRAQEWALEALATALTGTERVDFVVAAPRPESRDVWTSAFSE